MFNKTYLTLLCLCLWAGLTAQTQYNGPVGGDWFTATNWTNGLPASGNDALISGGTSVTISSPLLVDFNIQNFGDIEVTVAVANNGSILNGGSMNFTSSANLDNFGNLQNNGTATFSGAATFNNNPSGVFVNSGTFTLQTLLDNQGSLTNNGILDASAGTLVTQGAFENNQDLTTQSLTVFSGSSFTNNSGADLNITSSGLGILVQGLLNNFGTINNGGELTIDNIVVNIGTIQGAGDINVEAGAQLTNSGTLSNQGILTNNGTVINGGLLQNNGFLNNFGQLTNNNELQNDIGATLINRPSGSVTMNFGSLLENEGTTDNRGDISSVGTIRNLAGGDFSNSGDIDNLLGSQLENLGSFTNAEDIFINDVFRNEGTFNNDDDIIERSGGVFTNLGTFLNANGADVLIQQDFFNETGALFANEGTFTVEVRASIGGSFVNNDEIANEGDITIISGGTLTNNSDFEQTSGNIQNEGTLDNPGNLDSDECSTIHNEGIINNGGSILLQGILFQYGSLTGNPVTEDGSYTHTALTSDAPDICENGTFGADINGEVKVYASELVAFENFDSCENIVYLADGVGRPVFSCSDIGSVLNVGLTLTTRLGDKLTCTAEVTPVDGLEPQFSTPCPEDIFVTTFEAAVAVNWTPPVAVDNCTPVTLNATHNPGDLFSSGNTTVTYTASDDYGNTGTCGFNVIVSGLTSCTVNESPVDNATDVDFSTVTLSWAAAPNAILYDVYLGTTNPPTVLVAPGVPATSVSVSGLADNTIHYWYVVPRNLNGDATGCEANVTQFTTAIACDNVTDAGSIGSDQTLCNGATPEIIDNLATASGGSRALTYLWQKAVLDPSTNPAAWQDIANSDSPSFNPGILTETTWLRRGAKREGCEDFIYTVPVEIELLEVPLPVLDVQQSSCDQPLGIVNITNLPSNAYSSLDGGATTTGMSTYTDITVGQHTITIGVDGCETTAPFEINDFYTAPVAVCQNLTRQLSFNSVTIEAEELDNGSTGTCLPLSFTVNGQSNLALSCGDLGATTVTLQVTDALGGMATCQATITLEDDGTPTISCKNVAAQLDINGQASIQPGDVFQNAGDNCGVVNLQSVQPSSFDCEDLGQNQVVLTAEDGNGNTASCTATVTVEDNVPPSVSCKNISVQLGDGGQVSIQPEDVFQNASDNCGDVVLQSVQPSQFVCGNVGSFTVSLTVEDGSGNPASCTANVTVEDGIAPNVSCKNISVQLDANGHASIQPEDVFQNASDNCGEVALQSVQPSHFVCGNAGNTVVLLTAEDASGNTAFCTATVTVEDKIAPNVSCKNTTVQLDANGQASIQPEDVFQNASDNCGDVALQSVQPSHFVCGNAGNTVVLLTAEDASGNTAFCTATVTVEDKISPSVSCKNFNVDLDENGLAFIEPTDVFQSGADNCGSVEPLSVEPSYFDYTSVGENIVTLTVTDQYSNTSTCTANVEVGVDANTVTAYTILAYEKVHLHGNIVFGNVGVWKDGKEGKIHDHSVVNGFLKAPKEDISDNSLVTEGFIAANAPEPGTFKYNTMPEPDDDIKIPDNYPGIYVLEGTHFKKIEIGKNSTAMFNATGEIFIKELKTKDADEGMQTTLLFSGLTELIVRKKVEFGKRSAINPDGAGCVKIYVEEDGVDVKERSHVNANIDVRFKELDVDKSKEDDPTVMIGQFIGKKVKGDDFVEWEWQPFPCGQPASSTAPLLVAGDQLNLAASNEEGEVQLTWVTNTEYKNEMFVVERSADGVNFEPLFEVTTDHSGGTPTAVYRDEDSTPFFGANFYRVQAIFNDGTSKYSSVRLANVAIDRSTLTVFPNPAQHHVSMFWEKYEGKPGTVVISNSLGNPVLLRQFDELPGEPVRFELNNLPEGLYWLMLKVDDYREISRRFMVGKVD